MATYSIVMRELGEIRIIGPIEADNVLQATIRAQQRYGTHCTAIPRRALAEHLQRGAALHERFCRRAGNE
jgi:hypothetical protein